MQDNRLVYSFFFNVRIQIDFFESGGGKMLMVLGLCTAILNFIVFYKCLDPPAHVIVFIFVLWS